MYFNIPPRPFDQSDGSVSCDDSGCVRELYASSVFPSSDYGLKVESLLLLFEVAFSEFLKPEFFSGSFYGKFELFAPI